MGIARIAHWLVPLALFLPMLGYAQKSDETASSRLERARKRWAAIEAASPLHYALYRKNYDDALAAMPLAKDIDMIEGTTGMTGLGVAARDESADAIDMVQALVLRFGADPKIVDAEGNTALHYAAAAGNLAVVQFLVRMGAEVDAENPALGSRFTPLAMALATGRTRVADYLLEQGADDFDPARRDNLELSASTQEAARGLASEIRSRPREILESDPRESARRTFEALAAATAETLRAQGRTEDLKNWQQYTDLYLKVIEATPVEPGMSRSEYSKKVRAKFAAEQYGIPTP